MHEVEKILLALHCRCKDLLLFETVKEGRYSKNNLKVFGLKLCLNGESIEKGKHASSIGEGKGISAEVQRLFNECYVLEWNAQ